MNTRNITFLQTTFSKIYNEIYKKTPQNFIDVFLCGGASSKKTKSVRDKLRILLGEDNNIRVLYPEDLFIEMLNHDKNYDLLSLERFLADNSDIICIVCESPGSLVELGAFTNNDNTVDKVIALIEKKRKKQKSFIMLGPVKILRKINEERVIFYEDDLKVVSSQLLKAFRNIKRHQLNSATTSSYKPINTLIGLHHFIPLILYFFTKIESKNLSTSLKRLFEENDFSIKDFETMFRPTLKLLYKDKIIYKNKVGNNSEYLLTEIGHQKVIEVLEETNIKDRNKLYDSIRFSIINDKYYRSS